ncbi:MAG TPA: hypothetical protein VNO86_08510 [Candidatus Binatia bacterium]|nr:hypothetical protein [Candidatus Binatia bacterium]
MEENRAHSATSSPPSDAAVPPSDVAGPPATATAAPTADPRRSDLVLAAVWAMVAIAVYVFTTSPERNVFDYFVRLADAFLHGRLGVTEAPSWLNELIPAGDGLWYVPYPPMPAVVLLPVVALFGTEIHQQLVSAVLGGLSVGLAWLALGRLGLVGRARFWLTATFGFGTVLWYVAEVGSAWYFAHVVAVLFSLAALVLVLERRGPGLAGLLLGCATLARLPVGLSAPFFLAAALGLGWPPRRPDDTRAAVRTGLAFVAGLAVPLAAYALYNLARWGTPIDQGYVRIPGIFEDPIYAEHGILSIHYIPRNLYAIFFRSWNYVDQPPYLQPSWWGLSVFFTTPVYLWLAKARLDDPRVVWAAIGTGLALIPIVTHGNVGITQFGYRFSLDVQPLLFVILASAFRDGMSKLAQLACLAAIATSAYAIWAIGIGFVAF